MDEWGTSRGVPLTGELLDQLAEEAERGFDVERLQPHPHREDLFERPPAAGPRADE